MSIPTPHQVAKNWEDATPQECMILKQHIVKTYGWSIDPSKLLICCEPWAARRIIDVSVKGVSRDGLADPEAHILFRINEQSTLYPVSEEAMKDLGY